MSNLFKDYYYLTKPGIIRGNLFTAAAGFLFASAGDIRWVTFVFTLLGTALVIASGCVLNNAMDSKIDARMLRTKARAIPSGRVSIEQAVIYGFVLGLSGFAALAFLVNALTAYIGLAGLFFYVVVYGFAKRRTVHSTLIGTVAGATPPLAGYAAAAGHLNPAAWLLFLILVAWQMPHFYAIGIFRRKEYKAAKLPILTVERGNAVTKLHILVWILLFFAASSSLYVLGYVSQVYLGLMLALTGYWIFAALPKKDIGDEKWARQLFGISLLVLTVFSAAIATNFLFQ